MLNDQARYGSGCKPSKYRGQLTLSRDGMANAMVSFPKSIIREWILIQFIFDAIWNEWNSKCRILKMQFWNGLRLLHSGRFFRKSRERLNRDKEGFVWIRQRTGLLQQKSWNNGIDIFRARCWKPSASFNKALARKRIFQAHSNLTIFV